MGYIMLNLKKAQKELMCRKVRAQRRSRIRANNLALIERIKNSPEILDCGIPIRLKKGVALTPELVEKIKARQISYLLEEIW